MPGTDAVPDTNASPPITARERSIIPTETAATRIDFFTEFLRTIDYIVSVYGLSPAQF
jgi:hypothetical protein